MTKVLQSFDSIRGAFRKKLTSPISNNSQGIIRTYLARLRVDWCREICISLSCFPMTMRLPKGTNIQGLPLARFAGIGFRPIVQNWPLISSVSKSEADYQRGTVGLNDHSQIHHPRLAWKARLLQKKHRPEKKKIEKYFNIEGDSVGKPEAP